MKKNRFRHLLEGPLGYVLAFAALVGFVLTIFSFISGSSSVQVLGSIRERGTIKVGIQEDMLPFGKIGDDKKAQGFEAEMATLLGQKVLGGTGVQFFAVNSKNALAYLDNGDCDILFSMVVANSTNEDNYNLSDPYVQEDVTLLSKNGDLVSLQSPETKIGVIRASDAKSILTAYLTGSRFNATVLDIDSYPDAMAAIQKGTITAFCAPRSTLQKYVGNGMAISPVTVGQINYAFAVNSSNDDLFNAFVDAMKQVKKEGKLNELYSRYHLLPPQ